MCPDHASPLPSAMLLAWWGTAWLRGAVATDTVLDAMAQDAAAHSVRTEPGAEPLTVAVDEGASLVPLLAALRRAGAESLGATFPVEGDPLGLGGPRNFNLDATEAGEALLCPGAGLGAVPHRVGAGVTWTVHPARPRPVADVGEADRGLKAALLRALDDLERLDVARWSPETADEIDDLRRPVRLPAVPEVPPRALDVASRALSALAVATVALRDHGGAVSAAEVSARAVAVQRLDRAARAALAAAASPWCWPP